MLKKKRANQRGWTFIETLIVMAIILILAGTVGFVGFRYIDRAKVASTKSQMQTFALALNAYFFDCGRYPTTDQGLSALWRKPILEPLPSRWDGPYVTKEPENDPWGNPYEYRTPGPNNLPYEVVSRGGDGLPGGEGSNADIRSWDE